VLRRTSPDRLVAAGGAIAGMGGSAVVGYFIYVESGANRNFWTLPGIVSVVVVVVGLVLLLAGLMAPAGREPPRQMQTAGDRSTNLQARRDVRIGEGANEDDA
jgi:hypothetical protein